MNQQGQGIVDVTTHLVDLVQWECFPGKIIDYKKDVQLLSARSWNTAMTLDEFTTVTKESSIPSYLQSAVDKNGHLLIKCNGEINYAINGVHAKVSVIWNYKAPEGTGDTHYSIMRGTKCNLIIRQGKEENYKPTLYIEPHTQDAAFASALNRALTAVSASYPGIGLSKIEKGWIVTIPEKYNEGHEAHFARVTEKYLEYLQKNNMPAWEVPNMITKYFITTSAKALAEKQ